jgi:hypothetical protein
MSTVAMNCRPERSGFWYRVLGPKGARFQLGFIALGTGGYQTSGDIDGVIDEADDWKYWPVHFNVMQAAVTSFDVQLDPNGSLAWKPNASLLREDDGLDSISRGSIAIPATADTENRVQALFNSPDLLHS